MQSMFVVYSDSKIKHNIMVLGESIQLNFICIFMYQNQFTATTYITTHYIEVVHTYMHI